jgi:type II secretory pathway pseudopilin PulG
MKQKGFTLVELLVIAPVVMITIVIAISFLFNLYGQLIQQGAKLNLQSDAQTILFGLQDDLSFASDFSTVKDSSLTDTYAPSGGWAYNSTPPTLIIQSPASTANHRDPNRTAVYINQVGCTPGVPLETMQENPLAYNNIIYFASGSNLYKRILSPPTTTSTCGTSYLKQTCPATNTTTTCQKDILLSNNLASLTMTYYDSNNAVVTNPSLADKVKVDITLQVQAFAETVSATSSLTMRKFN